MSAIMKTNSDIDLLILDYIEGTLSKEQETELCEWVEASEQNTEYFSQSIAYLELTYTASKSEKYNSYKNWGRIESKINKRSKLLRIGREFLLLFWATSTFNSPTPGNRIC